MENKISKDKNLLVLNNSIDFNPEIKYLVDHFCGQVVNNINELEITKFNKVFICGDIIKIENKIESFYVIKELSTNFENIETKIIDLGKVPIIISNVGVYYRNLFTLINL